MPDSADRAMELVAEAMRKYSNVLKQALEEKLILPDQVLGNTLDSLARSARIARATPEGDNLSQEALNVLFGSLLQAATTSLICLGLLLSQGATPPPFMVVGFDKRKPQ